MPYRRLPNTDAARLRALEEANDQAKKTNPMHLAFSQTENMKLKNLLPRYIKILDEHRRSYINRVKTSKAHTQKFNKAKMYLSHFVQVFNLAVIRGEINEKERDYFQLEKGTRSVPVVNTDEELIEWGKKIVHGEQSRIAAGGNPIYNPKIAVVKIEYEKLVSSSIYHNKLVSIHKENIVKLEDMRTEIDKLILCIWNAAELYYSELPPKLKRTSSEKYGIKYINRKKEKIVFDI